MAMKTEKNIVGLLAHVDAGKTTLSEALLYMTRSITKLGRVDQKTSLLDNDPIERKRGITIFNKEARFDTSDHSYIIEDTPGHIDFSMEMERVLPILDMAILLVDVSSDIKAYTKRLFSLLKAYDIPTIIFLNKFDLAYTTKEDIYKKVKEELSDAIIDFTSDEDKIKEDIATLDEVLFDKYLNGVTITKDDIKRSFINRKFFPCIHGSALKHTNIQRLLDTLDYLYIDKEYPDDFKAYVYRISYDKRKEMLTAIKINGGILKVKDKILNDKVDEIRAYNGPEYKALNEAKAGDLVTLKGPNTLLIGEYINDDQKDKAKVMVPYLDREISSPNTDKAILYKRLLAMQKEDPLLNVRSDDDRITVSLMGDIQMEVLTTKLKEEGIDVSFSDSKVTYKETITRQSYGIGHYEPLRHYCEVHLKVRPLKRGQGKSVIDPNKIGGNHFEVISEYLTSKTIKGVLIGAEVIDIEIAILAIKTSLSHTTNDDIRKACDFALRNALLDNEMILLEPYERFRIKVDTSDLSSVIYNIEKLGGTYKVSDDISGTMSAIDIQELMKTDVIKRKNIYIEHSFDGYDVADDMDMIINEKGYDPYNDPDEMSGSIFFKNGAGYYVDLDDTYELAHIKPLIDHKETTTYSYNRLKIDDEEVKRVFERSNPKKKDPYIRKIKKEDSKYVSKEVKKPPLYIVDGYNALYTQKKDPDMNGDIEWLLDELSYYQSMKNVTMWVVFDAYKVDNPSNKGHDLKVIYTDKDETADAYIQRMVRELKDQYSITVVTSDKLIQVAIFSFGAYRKSSRALFDEIRRMKEDHPIQNTKTKNTPLKDLLKDIDVDDE